VIARHRLVGDGTGAVIRDSGHVNALEAAAMAGASSARPHRRKERIPPGPAALHAANVLRGNTTDTDPIIDLTVYAAAAAARRDLP
jgi:hypothetical protein